MLTDNGKDLKINARNSTAEIEKEGCQEKGFRVMTWGGGRGVLTAKTDRMLAKTMTSLTAPLRQVEGCVRCGG